MEGQILPTPVNRQFWTKRGFNLTPPRQKPIITVVSPLPAHAELNADSRLKNGQDHGNMKLSIVVDRVTKVFLGERTFHWFIAG